MPSFEELKKSPAGQTIRLRHAEEINRLGERAGRRVRVVDGRLAADSGG